MLLRAKIKNKYLKEILEEGKRIEYRQIEGIVLVDEGGKEHKFGVADLRVFPQERIDFLKEKYPDVEWNENLPTIAILLVVDSDRA